MSSNKKSTFRFFSSRHSNRKVNETRKPTLESLESRQLLSAVGFSSDNLVDSNQFQAVLGNKLDPEDTSDRYVILNVAAADGGEFNPEDLSIWDSEDKEVSILSSKVENGVASILAKYSLGETYVFQLGEKTDSGDGNDPAFNVLFTIVGDLDGNGEFSAEEYHTLFGEVQKGHGVNNRFISVFKNIYGVDISGNHFDAIYDVDGSGKISQNTFDTVIAPNFSSQLILTQEITTVPVIHDFEVNGTIPEKVSGQKYSFVTTESEALVLSGKTEAQDALLTWTDAEGNIYSGKLDLRESGSCVLTNKADEKDTVTLEYEIAEDESFTLSFPEELVCDGNIQMELWSDPEHTMKSNIYSLFIDLAEPELIADSASVKGVTANKDDGVYYVKSEEFTVVVSTKPADGATLKSLTEALEKAEEGLYVRIADEKGNEVARTRIEKSMLTEGSDGKVTVKDVEIPTKLTEGEHTLSITVTDLAGNVYGEVKVEISVTVDKTAPALEIEGYSPNFNYENKEQYDAMLTEKGTVTLIAKPKDASGTSVSCTLNGKTATPKEEGSLTYELELAGGLNSVIFTVLDAAGNSSKKTCLIYFAETLELTEEGEELQEEGFTQKYSGDNTSKVIDLYSLFSYDAGLTFKTSAADSALVTPVVSGSGILAFKFHKTPAEGEKFSTKITVTAENAVGKTCSLTFDLTYLRLANVDFWTDVKIEKDAADSSFADVEHIVAEDSIVISGKLTVPKDSDGVVLNVKYGENEICSGLDLGKSFEKENIKYEYDSEAGTFTLTLQDLDDGEYVIQAQDASLDETLVQELSVWVDTVKPGVTPSISLPSTAVTENPKFTVKTTGALNSQDLQTGARLLIYVSKTDGSEMKLYASADYDSSTLAFGELKYDSKVNLSEGVWFFTSKVLDAAGNETMGNSLTVTFDKTAPVVSIPKYEENYHFEDNEKFDSMKADSPEFQLAVSVTDISSVTMVCTQNGNEIAASSQDGSDYVFDFTLKSGINEILFTVTDSTGQKTTKLCRVYCEEGVKLTEAGEELQKNGFTQEYSAEQEKYAVIDLTQMFNYGNNLSFKVTSSNASVARVAVDEKGVLSFTYPTTPEYGQKLTSEITVEAENTLGSKAELTFALTFVRYAELLKNVTIENDYSEDSLADVKHIIRQNTLKMSGKLELPEGQESAFLTIQRDSEVIFSEIDLTQSQTLEGLEYVYDSENGTFTLTLLEVADGLFSFGVFTDGAEGSAQEIPVIVDTKKPEISVGVSLPEYSQTPPEVSLTLPESVELNQQDASQGVWIEVIIENAEGDQAVYARAKYDVSSGTIGELEYSRANIFDGSYVLFAQTIDAARNTTRGSNSVSLILDSLKPQIQVEGYSPNYHLENKEEFDSMLVKKQSLDLSVEITDENPDSLLCSVNEKEVEGTLNEDGTVSFTLILEEGLNTILFTAVDKAGNSRTQTCLVIWEDMPELTEAGLLLQENGFFQAAGEDPSVNKTLDLNLLFDYEGELEFTAESQSPTLIQTEISDSGILSFRYPAELEQDERIEAEIEVTAQTVHGTSASLVFVVTYLNDETAPQWVEVIVKDDLADDSLANRNEEEPVLKHIVAQDTISVTGKLFDVSEIENATLTILKGGEPILSNVDLLTGKSEEAWTYSIQENSGAFTFSISGLDDGVYLFCVCGKDALGNESSMDSGNFQSLEILVETEAPSVTAEMTLVQTGSSQTSVNKNPEFVLSASGAPSEIDARNGVWAQIYVSDTNGGNKVLYAQAKYDALEGEFGELEYFLTETLGDGNWLFSIQTVNAAGLSTFTEESQKTIKVDSAAPIIDGMGYVEDYDSSDYGKYSMKGTAFDSMYLTEEFAPDGKYDLGIYAKNDATAVFDVSILHVLTGESVKTDGLSEIPLLYGRNEISVTAVDESGNESTRVFIIYLNDTPTLTSYGKELEENGFYQLANSSGPNKNIPLNNCLTDFKALEFSNLKNVTGNTDEIEPYLLAQNIAFNYFKEPEGENGTISAEIQVTATDEFGETVTLTFMVYYVLDSIPPQLKELELEGSPNLNPDVLATAKNEILLSGELYDLAGIEQAELDIILNEESDDALMILDSIDLQKNSSGKTENGWNYEYSFTENEQGTGGEFTLRIFGEEGEAVSEGLYSCYVAGKDKIGNDSIEDTETSEQKFLILVDRVAPELSAEMELVKTGTGESRVNSNPAFTIKLTDAQPEEYGTWVQIILVSSEVVDGEEKTTESVYAQGIVKDGNCEMIWPEEELAEGKWNFRIQTIDAAGNVHQMEGIQEITVDRTPPTFVVFSMNHADDSLADGTWFTTDKNLRIFFTPSETEVILWYSRSSELTDPVRYDSSVGIDLEYGKNSLYFWLEDAAGNKTPSEEMRLLQFTYDSRPVIVENTQGLTDVYFDFPDENTEEMDSWTWTMTLSQDELLAMVTDEDLESGDQLSYSLDLVLAEDLPNGILTMDVKEDGEGNFVLSFTTESIKDLRGANKLGTISFVVKDKNGLSPEDPEGLLTFDIFKKALPLEIVGDSISVPQNEYGNYVFEMDSIFSDPQNNEWIVTQYEIWVNGEKADGVTLSEDGRSILWTPNSGKYGNITIKAAAANVDMEGNILEGTETSVQDVAGTVEWSGYALILKENANIELKEGDGEFSERLLNYLELSNSMDSDLVWGDYSISVSGQAFSIEEENAQVHGFVLNEDGSRKESYSSLFADGPMISENGENLVFALNENAYGTVDLKVIYSWIQDGESKTADCLIPFVVMNEKTEPYVKEAELNLPVGENGGSVDLLNGCSAGEDEGTLKADELKFDSVMEGFTAGFVPESSYFVIQNAEYTWYFDAEMKSGSIQTDAGAIENQDYLIFRMIQILDKNREEVKDAAVWNLLDGVWAKFSYSVTNTETEMSTGNFLTLTLAAAPFDLSATVERKNHESKVSADLLSRQKLDSEIWNVKSVDFSPEGSTSGASAVRWENGEFIIPAGWYGTANFICSFENEKTNDIEQSKLTLSVPQTNVAPIWADGVETEIGVYEWNCARNLSGIYSLDLKPLIQDFDNSVLDFEMLTIPEEGTFEISEDGILTFTAPSADYLTEGLNFSVRASSSSVADDEVASDEFLFKLVIEDRAEAPEIQSMELASGNSVLKFAGKSKVNINVSSVSETNGTTQFQIAVSQEDGTILDTVMVEVFASGSENLSLSITGSGLTENENGWTAEIANFTDMSWTLTVTNSAGSDSQNLAVKADGTVTIIDESLNVKSVENALSKTLGVTAEVVETTEVDAEIAEGSLLKAGTVLKPDTKLSFNAYQSFSDQGSVWERKVDEGGKTVYYLKETLTLTGDLKIDANCENVTASVLGEGSILARETYLKTEVSCLIADISDIVTIYENYANDGDLLSMEIPAAEFENLEIKRMEIPAIPENHTIADIFWNSETGIMTVTYAPYQVDQDRSPITVQIVLESGEIVNYAVSMEYEKPFSLSWTLTNGSVASELEKLPSSVESIEAGKTYYLNVWFQCDLPVYSEDLAKFYELCVFGSIIEVSVNAEAVSGFSSDTMDQAIENDELLVNGSTFIAQEMSGADGKYLSLGQFKLVTTGNAGLEFTTRADGKGVSGSTDLSIGIAIPFKEQNSKEIGIGGTISSKQIVNQAAASIPLAEAVAPMSAVLPEVLLVSEDWAVIGSFAMEQADDSRLLSEFLLSDMDGMIELEEIETQAESSSVAVVSYFEGEPELLGCSTASATNILNENQLVKALASASAIQSAANALTDLVIEEVFSLNVEKEENIG